MKGTGRLLVGLIVVVAVVGAVVYMQYRGRNSQGTEPIKGQVERLSIRLNWIPLSTFSGFIVARDKGFFEEQGLDVTINPGSIDLNPVKMVASGSDDIGVLEPAQVISARVNQGIPLKIIALTAQESPFALMSLRSKGIDSPKKLVGAVVGYNPLNDASYLSLLRAAGVDRKQLNEEPVQFDLSRFFEHKVDVWPSFVTNEVLVARGKGLEVTLLRPDDYGAHVYEMALFASDKTIAARPQVLTRFLRAWAKGWQYALAHRDEAASMIARNSASLDSTQQHQVLDTFAPLMLAGQARTNGIGWVDTTMIGTLATSLSEMGLIKSRPAASDLVDNSFLLAVPKAERLPGVDN